MQSINSLADIADDVDVFFIDIFGVLWNGDAFYPQALEVCKKIIACGKRIYLLSNSTTISQHFKEKHIKNSFFQGVYYTDAITSGDVLKYKLEKENFLDDVTGSCDGKYLLIGRPNDMLLASVLNRQTLDIDEASAVYLSSLQDKDTYLTTIDSFLPQTEKALKRGLPAICSNPDYFAFQKEIRRVAQGSLGKWYEDNGGIVYWVGKPYQNIYDYALKKAEIQPTRCAMVGDTIRTDILGGFNAGMKTVLILKTGITQDLLNKGDTVDSISKREGAYPDYLLEEGLK